MEFKRFLQLFIVYSISIFIPLLLIKWLKISSFSVMLGILIVIGYLVMTIPLTIMTLLKNK